MSHKKRQPSDDFPRRWAAQWLKSLSHYELPRLPDDELATEEMPAVHLENPSRSLNPTRKPE